MKKLVYILLVALAVTSALDASGKSYYNSARNNFGGLYPHPGMRMQGRYKAIEDDRLVEENATMATALGIDTMLIHSSSYRYQMRLANLNNKQGKVMSIKNPLTGGKTKVTSTQWGIMFNFDQMADYCAVVLNCDNSAPWDDITDRRSMQVSLVQHTGNEQTVLAQATLTKGVSLEDELNTICIDVDERSVKVSIGKDELHQVLEAPVQRPTGPVQVGYLVGPGASLSIERAVLTIDNEQQVAATSTWTLEALDEYLAQSSDPVEGYWHYLDRDMQGDWLRLGGRYSLAVVGKDGGYDLIYIDGAQVKKSLWQPGMIKGHITPTIFSGNYDLSWIDATMEPIGDDAYATIENGVLLTLVFPEYKSQVRFAKATVKS